MAGLFPITYLIEIILQGGRRHWRMGTSGAPTAFGYPQLNFTWDFHKFVGWQAVRMNLYDN
jgi:hypothetical protein